MNEIKKTISLLRGKTNVENDENKADTELTEENVEVVEEVKEDATKASKTTKKATTRKKKAEKKETAEENTETEKTTEENTEEEPIEEVKETPKKETKQPELPKVKTIDSFVGGIESDELLELNSKEMSKEEEDLRVYQNLQKYAKNGQVLWGEIYGVEPSGVLNQAIIAVLYNNTKISIPDSEFFEPSFDFNNYAQGYHSMSEKEKLNVRTRLARYQIGARVCFCIKKVVRQKIEDEHFEGEYELVVGASRKEAMKKRRDLFFSTKQTPYTVNEGDIIKNAAVLSVNENRVTVECCGVETRIDAFDLNNDYVENCQDVVQPGDRIPVRIKTIHNDNGSVYLKVSGRLNETPKAILTMRAKATYAGVVDHYNAKLDRYSIQLLNGVGASVRSEDVQGGVSLSIGDRVQVKVTKVLPTFVLGLALKV